MRARRRRPTAARVARAALCASSHGRTGFVWRTGQRHPRSARARRRSPAAAASDLCPDTGAAAVEGAAARPPGSALPIRVRLEHRRQRVGDRFAGEQPLARQHLEEHDPNAQMSVRLSASRPACSGVMYAAVPRMMPRRSSWQACDRRRLRQYVVSGFLTAGTLAKVVSRTVIWLSWFHRLRQAEVEHLVPDERLEDLGYTPEDIVALRDGQVRLPR